MTQPLPYRDVEFDENELFGKTDAETVFVL